MVTATVALAVATATQVLCKRCNKIIAAWDAARECIVFELPRYRVYVEIPGHEAVVQCHREIWESGRFVVCGYVNRVRVP